MTLPVAFSILVVIATVWALIRRFETRLVLITAGLAMALFSLKPMAAFQQFDASMTKGSLIIAICSAMGFAAAVSLTKCDVHLVALLTRPLRRLGVLLLPACMLVTGLCAVAIPSTAGLCAAVGPSMIPILIRAGFRPAIAAAAIVCATTPALFTAARGLRPPMLSKSAVTAYVAFPKLKLPRLAACSAMKSAARKPSTRKSPTMISRDRFFCMSVSCRVFFLNFVRLRPS